MDITDLGWPWRSRQPVRAIVTKRCKIRPRLLLITDMKLHIGFQMTWKSSTLDDLKSQWQPVRSAILATAGLLVNLRLFLLSLFVKRILKSSICIAHHRKHVHASNVLSSLTRATCRTATVCSLQTQAGAAAGSATPVSCTKVSTFRNSCKWVTTHFTVPRRIEGWVDLAGRLRTEMVYLPGVE